MKTLLWWLYVILVYLPSLCIGTVLSVLMMPLVIGWKGAEDWVDLTV